MHNIPSIPSYIQAPWEEEEWVCPTCGGHQDDVDCEPGRCDREFCVGCGYHVEDCECEGEE